jgi:hypothetical protein
MLGGRLLVGWTLMLDQGGKSSDSKCQEEEKKEKE